jgi:hypothetical protein
MCKPQQGCLPLVHEVLSLLDADIIALACHAGLALRPQTRGQYR